MGKASGITCIYADIGGDADEITAGIDYESKYNELKREYDKQTIEHESFVNRMTSEIDFVSKTIQDSNDERAKAEETIKELEGLNEFYKNKVEFYKGQVEAYQYCMNCRR